jgi:hypothetical protein
MAGRERMRIVLCEALSLHPFGKECSNEKITQAFRQSVQANFGEDGLGAFGGFGKVVINFTQFCGFFAIRVTGRMSNAVKAATEHLILWRNSLPQDYAVPRKEHLNKLVREAVSSLSAVPSYT